MIKQNKRTGFHQCAEKVIKMSDSKNKGKIDVSKLTPRRTDFDVSSPIYGKVFLFTGDMQHFPSVPDAAQMIWDSGGMVKNKAVKTVDYLVKGGAGYKTQGKDEDMQSTKYLEIQRFREMGCDISIITEDELIELAGWELDENDMVVPLSSDNPDFPLSAIAEEEEAIISGSLGCCASYRTCSELGKSCGNPDCAYGKNLDAGKIFYGKHAINFDMNRYELLCSAYISLNPEEIALFDQIVTLFTYKKRLIKRAIIESSDTLTALSNKGLVIANYDPYAFLNLYSYQHISKFVPSSARADIKRQMKESGLSTTGAMKDIYISWLLDHAPDTVQELTGFASFVSLPDNMFQYYDELFFDFVSRKSISFDLKNPFLGRKGIMASLK